MSVLDLLKKVKVQTLSFEKHPCRELDQEMMVHYLNGLALITNEDGNVCEKEREYLEILINSFGLSEDMLETFVNFAENPDEKLILDMMQSFSTKDIKYNFMVDAMMIASVDGEFDESENAIIEQYFEMFKITKKEAEDLRYIYEMFYTQNGNALFRYFGKQDKDDIFKIKPENFQYLLDYYKIDMAYELIEDEKKILTFEFFKPTFESGGLGEGATEIMTKPVSNAQFCIFLNAAFMGKKIEFDGDGKIVDSETKDLLMDLVESDIDIKNNVFLVDSAEDEEKKVTGVTYVISVMFIVWVSESSHVEYQITSWDGFYNISMGSFAAPLFDEFLFNKYSSNYTRIDYYVGKKNGVCVTIDSDDSNYPTTSTFLSNNVSFRMMKLPNG